MDENVDHKPLIIKEMVQAKELLKELQAHLNPSSFTGHDLITKILSSVENFLSRLEQVKMERKSAPESPLGDCNSDHLFPGGSRKRFRNGAVRWTEQVRVSTQLGLEGPIEDGYDWRKYGQKDILGAKHPRAYYRCSYGSSQGCLAMKQIQRSELDPSIFDVTYIGKHSCVETPEMLSREYAPNKQEHDQHEQREDKPLEETFINFQTSSVQVAKGKDKQLESFLSFSIYSTTSLQPNIIGNCSETKENLFCPSSITPEIHSLSPSPSPTPTFISTPTASEFNHKMHNIGEDLLQTTADSHDVNSSANNSYSNLMDSSWDWDFPIDCSPPYFY